MEEIKNTAGVVETPAENAVEEEKTPAENVNTDVQEPTKEVKEEPKETQENKETEGCKGVGDKTARKILGEVGGKSLEEMWDLVKSTYKKQGFTEEDALLNARMARILRAEDYDFKNKKVKLWEM